MPPLTTADAPATDTSASHTIPPVNDSAVARVTPARLASSMMADASGAMTAFAHRLRRINIRGCNHGAPCERRRAPCGEHATTHGDPPDAPCVVDARCDRNHDRRVQHPQADVLDPGDRKS